MGLKKWPLLIFFLCSVIFAPIAHAESQTSLEGVADSIQRLFGFIPNVITLEKLLGQDEAAMFWARFLLWLLIFAGVFYGAGFAFKSGKEANTRIAGTVSFVFATIGALLIPDKIIMGIFQSYGLLSAILIWFVPVIAGFFLVSMIKPRLVKALIYLGMIFMLVAIDASITSSFAVDLDDNQWYPFFKLLLAFVIIAFLWNLLFSGIDGWNAAVPGGHGGGGGGGGHDGGGAGGGAGGGHNGGGHNPAPGPNPPGPGPHPPGPNPPPGPGPHPPRPHPDRDEEELKEERKIWLKLKNEVLPRLEHLIGHCRHHGYAGQLRAKFDEVLAEKTILDQLTNKELQEENDNERRQRLEQLGVDNSKIDRLLVLIRQERNAYNLFNAHINAIDELITAGILAIPRNDITNEQLTNMWNAAKNFVEDAMKVLEVLIRINAHEIQNLRSFSRNARR